MTTKRRYTLKDRARSQDETHRRIVEAAVALHEELGPRATTISAIAERAGVQRLTVYRHLPDDTALFRACTSHWREAHPLPRDWAEVEESGCAAGRGAGRLQRLPRAQPGDAFGGASRWTVGPGAGGAAARGGRDARRNPRELSAGLGPRGAATLALALAFPTWEALEAQGLDDDAKTELALAWLAGAAEADATTSR